MNLHPEPGETIAGLADDMNAGRRSSAEAVEACLARIDARDPVVRAWVVVDREGAIQAARALDAERAAGRVRGPLHGIPVGIKDILDVAGLPTAAGTKKMGDRPARVDAPVVARLREAGAVILGKTVTTPYAWIDPPPTTNPWDPERTPGGSSSGSAAAVASGMCLAALGSQTGGSITRPAAFCGVTGLKPGYGRLPVEGILPLAPSLDHPGPIARTAVDLALVWQALRPDDPPATPPAQPPRLGRLGGLFREKAGPEALDTLEHALAVLHTAGAVVSDFPLPRAFGDVLPRHRTIMAAEAAAVHADRVGMLPEEYPERITQLIVEGDAILAVDYLAAREHQRELTAETVARLAGFDALISPAAPGVAPDRSTTGDPALNSPWSYTGLPTVTIPVTLSAEGLPLGIQLVGHPGGEAALLGLAAWCEGVLARRGGGA